MTPHGAHVGPGAGIPLRKRYGQHHLVRPEACDPLLDFLQPHGSRVLEIGPGGGVLTARLVAAAARVTAIEVDIAWAAALGAVLRGRAQVVVADALQMAWQRLPRGTLIAGNLPFNISTVLIGELSRYWQRVPRMAFLVQREVADRLLAGPGDSAYGALSVLTSARARVQHLGIVKAGSFRPPPKVDGAFVGLEPVRPHLSELQMGRLESTVHLAFAQRRKQLRNALAAGWGREVSERALAAARIDPRSRAEELSLEAFVELNRFGPGTGNE